MSNFYAKICLNGHDLIERSPLIHDEYCEKCGAKMIAKCPHCDTAIKEWDYTGVAVIGLPRFEKPMYCKSCGKPYPWTEAAIETTKLLIMEEEELSEQLKTSLVESLPDVIVETPKTNLAVVRLKKGLASAGRFTADAIRQFAIDFGCEFAKKSLGL